VLFYDVFLSVSTGTRTCGSVRVLTRTTTTATTLTNDNRKSGTSTDEPTPSEPHHTEKHPGIAWCKLEWLVPTLLHVPRTLVSTHVLLLRPFPFPGTFIIIVSLAPCVRTSARPLMHCTGACASTSSVNWGRLCRLASLPLLSPVASRLLAANCLVPAGSTSTPGGLFLTRDENTRTSKFSQRTRPSMAGTCTA
jgi:hypothetical protein